MKEKELYILNKVNQEAGLDLQEAKYEYCRFDAYNNNYIAEIKFREQDYKHTMIEFDKYSFNKEYAKINNKLFLYIVGVKYPKRKIYIFNISDINREGVCNYNWEWKEDLPKTTEFENKDKVWKYVGYINRDLNTSIIELDD